MLYSSLQKVSIGLVGPKLRQLTCTRLPLLLYVFRCASHSGNSDKDGNNEGRLGQRLEVTKKKRTYKASHDLVKELTWTLHPGASDKKSRWKTKGEIKAYLGKSAKPRMRVGTPETYTARRPASVTSLMEKYREELDLHKINPIPKDEVDLERIERYVDTLRNSKERLGIFQPCDGDKPDDEEVKPEHKTAIDWWDKWDTETRESKVMEPSSHYKEMTEWTKEGKLPTFPIDNEEGLLEEQQVPFHKHVFLHDLLTDKFPDHPPIRRFMEAVILGLSKNPYLTVQEKEEHINWFSSYFDEKLDTLRAMGAVAGDKMIRDK